MNSRLAPRWLLACLIAFVGPDVGARADIATPQAVVDGVVKAVCHKRIVLLGEAPTHGEALSFDAKSKITNQLIAQCGFTAVLFEAPIYDFLGMQRAVWSGTATAQQLDNAIGRFWLTRELAPWRASLFAAATRKTLAVGGLDDQVSITSHYAVATMPGLIAAASPGDGALECRQVVSRNLSYTYDNGQPFDEPEKARLQQCARAAAVWAEATPSFDPIDRAMLENFGRYVERQLNGPMPSRDESMLRNLAWYLERLPRTARVVVWTATVHAARQRGALPDVPLGARAVERWGNDVGSIGFTAYDGFTSRAARPATAITKAPADTLEATSTAKSDWALLSAAQLRAIGATPSRVLGKFLSETWSNYFDAIIVIRHETAPTFDPWK